MGLLNLDTTKLKGTGYRRVANMSGSAKFEIVPPRTDPVDFKAT